MWRYRVREIRDPSIWSFWDIGVFKVTSASESININSGRERGRGIRGRRKEDVESFHITFPLNTRIHTTVIELLTKCLACGWWVEWNWPIRIQQGWKMFLTFKLGILKWTITRGRSNFSIVFIFVDWRKWIIPFSSYRERPTYFSALLHL